MDDEWEEFVKLPSTDNYKLTTTNTPNHPTQKISGDVPESTALYISTQSRITYLTNPVPLKIFWDIDVMPYHTYSVCVIKKEMRCDSFSKEEYSELNDHIRNNTSQTPYIVQHVLKHIDKPTSFKDERKVVVGLTNNDITSHKPNKKNAFRNCFILIVRDILNDGTCKNIHIKVFNTGKVEIPGVKNEQYYNSVLVLLINILQPFFDYPITYTSSTPITVLSNSNFNCKFFIDRDKMLKLLKEKYKLHPRYDPCCSYPGVITSVYYNTINNDAIVINLPDKIPDHIGKASFTIFRTGSVLISGKCTEKTLHVIYRFIVDILKTEYHNIATHPQITVKYSSKIKIQKRLIYID